MTLILATILNLNKNYFLDYGHIYNSCFLFQSYPILHSIFYIIRWISKNNFSLKYTFINSFLFSKLSLSLSDYYFVIVELEIIQLNLQYINPAAFLYKWPRYIHNRGFLKKIYEIGKAVFIKNDRI